MENKKNLKVSATVCDVRNITEQLLSTYEQVEINASIIITSQEAQALLGRYGVKLSASATRSLDEAVRFSSVNGSASIFPGQTMTEEKVFLTVNGSLEIEPGSEEVLKNYVGIMVNGSLTCPESMTGLLSSVTVNGATRTYPDGCVRLKASTVLDRFFHLRAKQDALYHAASKIIALSPDIDFGKLAEKNVRFITKKLLVAESLAEAAVPLFDDRADIVVLPDGCSYTGDDAELNEALLKRCGGKLYIDGDLTVTPDSAPLLDQISYLHVDGDLLVCRSLRDRVLELDVEYNSLYVVGGTLLLGRPAVELDAAMLEGAADGLSAMACARVSIAEDVTPELLREKLVSMIACACVDCTAAQRSVIESLAQDVAKIHCTDEDAPKAEEQEDENTVRISSSIYTF
ncbi:MAG: hypothetical protein K2O45_12045 [Oscillospiraceae bacterium]|nr:hypothetical protein [Oscillospiraceae bacterium]